MGTETALLHSVYREITELIGLENTQKIYEYFKGQQVTFPIHMYDPGLVKEAVAGEYDGENIRILVKKYGYSEKTIRRMLRE
ncbi:MAG: Mor transcription activator family protein [Clostridia bacterium]|nr:Mor transcription activator family protein [Clostridia bacterium]